MTQRFDTVKMANWLLGEAYNPDDPLNETEEELDTTGEEETEENEEADDGEENSETDDENSENEEEKTDEDIEDAIEDADINDRLENIENKLDDLIDNKPEADSDETFDLDLSNPVCPCCGARLNVVDNPVDDTEGEEETTDSLESDDDSTVDVTDLLDGEFETNDIGTTDTDDVESLGYDDSEYMDLPELADEDEEKDEED